MLNNHQKILISFFLMVFLFSAFYFLLSANSILAAGKDGPTINLTCIEGKPDAEQPYPWCSEAKEGIAPLVGKFYKIALGLAGASALGVLIYGSILWTLSGAVTSKQDAMGWISGALWGLVLLLGAYLILWTINPQLTILEEPKIDEVKVERSRAAVPYGATFYARNSDLLKKDALGTNWTPEEKDKLYTHAEALRILKRNGISVEGTGGLCENQNRTGCTSLNGIPKDMVTAIIKADKGRGKITITGGTENGHQQQGFGKASVDMRYNDDLYKSLQSTFGSQNVIRERPFNSDGSCSSGWKCYAHVTGEHISVYKPTADLKTIK